MRAAPDEFAMESDHTCTHMHMCVCLLCETSMQPSGTLPPGAPVRTRQSRRPTGLAERPVCVCTRVRVRVYLCVCTCV